MSERSPYEYSKRLIPVVKRVCLRCNKEFNSDGNRLCKRCNELNKNCSKLDSQSRSLKTERKPLGN